MRSFLFSLSLSLLSSSYLLGLGVVRTGLTG